MRRNITINYFIGGIQFTAGGRRNTIMVQILDESVRLHQTDKDYPYLKDQSLGQKNISLLNMIQNIHETLLENQDIHFLDFDMISYDLGNS